MGRRCGALVYSIDIWRDKKEQGGKAPIDGKLAKLDQLFLWLWADGSPEPGAVCSFAEVLTNIILGVVWCLGRLNRLVSESGVYITVYTVLEVLWALYAQER